MYLVTRPPYAALAVNKAFDALRDLFASYVEAARGQFVPAVDLQIGSRPTVGCRHHERCAIGSEIGKSPCVGPARTDFAHLEIVGRNVYVSERGGGPDIGDRRPQPVVVGTFDDQSEIRCHQVVLGHTRRTHVITLFRRIIPFVPLIYAPIVVGSPAEDIRFVFVPDLLVLCRQPPDRFEVGGFIPVVERIGFAE